MRFGGLQKEIDRKELAHAVEAMKATLKATLNKTSVLPSNLLKRPGTPLLEGVLPNKRTRLAKQEEDPTIASPISKVLNEIYPRSGKRTLENQKSRILSWDNEAIHVLESHSNAPNRTVQRKVEELAYLLNAGASGDAVQATVILVRMLNQTKCSGHTRNRESRAECR